MPTRAQQRGGVVSHYDPELNSRALTGLWASCPLLESLHDPALVAKIDEAWGSYDAAATTGDYVATQATAGTAAISTAAPGVLEIDSGSTTQGQGLNLQRKKAVIIPAAGKHIWAEFRFKLVTSLAAQLFVGLAESDTTVIAANALSTSNHIGWYSVTGDGVLLFGAGKAGVVATKASATLVAGTYVSLGFYVNGVTDITHYLNGVPYSTTHVTANIPIVALYPTLVCQTNGVTQPVLHSGGYRIVQLR